MATKVKVPSVEELFGVGAHFGHKSKHWHPKIKKFVHSTVKGIHVVDLTKTQQQLEKAVEFLNETAKNNKRIIFVGTKEQVRQIIETESMDCGALYVTDRWYGGTLTNFDNIRRNINKYIDLKTKLETNTLNDRTKKEKLLIQREVEKLAKSYEGLVGLTSMPGAVVIVDAKREKTAVNECKILNVPIVAICDTNTDPSNIDYPIPANDDAIKSVDLIIRTLGEAVKQGYSEVKKAEDTKEAKNK